MKRFLFFLVDHWVYISAPASENEDLVSTREEFPVLLFSHGNGANNTTYTATLINFASHGCVFFFSAWPTKGERERECVCVCVSE